MVGPGEVDDELEPEIKEECNTKYGDVSKVMIYEIPKTTPEEAVRIFVEFKRVESAIKGKKNYQIIFKCLHNVTVLLDFKFFHLFFSCGRPQWKVFWWPRSQSLILRCGKI